MNLCFHGGTHAAQTLSEAARRRGFKITGEKDADIVFMSADTPTDKEGRRETLSIRANVLEVFFRFRGPIVVTSQVEPGFMRGLDKPSNVYHMAETLRVEDAIQRAMYPEMIIFGSANGVWHQEVHDYCSAWDCPVILGSYEDAEFAKMAINAHLAMQVDTATWLAAIAERVGADWRIVQRVLRHDRRIGKYSYLTPGDWRKSSHILRDMVTLEGYEPRPPIP